MTAALHPQQAATAHDLIAWTEFPSKSAQSKVEHATTWAALVERIRAAGPFADKAAAPWLKLATFGEHRTDKNCLRSNANLRTVTGIEGDYDGGRMTPQEALERLERHGIRAAVYTSASHAPERPRWRVLCPLATHAAPKDRARLVARLNGALGGVLAGESFDLSQSYYFGKVTGHYGVWTTFDDPDEGECIDELHDLDRIAIGKPGAAATVSDGGERAPVELDLFERRVQELGRKLKSGDGRRELLKMWICSRSARHTGESDLMLQLKGIASCYFDPMDGIDWNNIETLVRDTVRKDQRPAVDLSGLLGRLGTRAQPAEIDPETGEIVPRYKLLSAAELRDLPPLSWRVRGVLPAQGLAALYGPSASGKSFLAFDMAAAIAEGQRWFDCRVTAAPVVYAALEGEAGFKLRVLAWEASRGRSLPDDLRMVLQPFRLTRPQDVADLCAVVPAGAVVFIDTLNRAAPTADENSSKDMGEILEAAKRLQAATGGLVVLVHHTGKDTARGLRGHSSLFAAMDACIEVARDSDRREWKVAKSKDGSDGDAHAFRLEVVELGHDEHGDAITSCAVAPADEATAKQPGKPLTPRQTEGLQALYRAAAEYGEESADELSLSVHLEHWRAEFYRTSTADGADAKRTAFGRVRDDLVKLGQVTVTDDRYSVRAGDGGLLVAQLLSATRAAK